MARKFNSTTDSIAANAAAPNLSGQQAFSIALWVNASIAQSSALNPLSVANSGAAGPFFQFQGTAGGKFLITARSSTSGGTDSTTSTATTFDSTWHHIGVTQPSGSSMLTIYVDGVSDHTFNRTSLSNNATQTFNSLTFGALQRTGSPAQLYGGIDAEIAIWSRTLAATEMSSLFAGVSPLLLGANHFWPLFGADSPEPDLGTSAHTTGTLAGTPSSVAGKNMMLLDLQSATVGA